MSETYTAVYERDGDAWVVEIAEEPRVRCLCTRDQGSLGDREVSIDTFCHTITMAEELSRLTAVSDRVSADRVAHED